MTDLLLTGGDDSWVNSLKPSLNYGSTTWVFVKSGERRGFVRPSLSGIAGRTVLAATLRGRVGPGHVAQTYTIAPVTGSWSPGRVTWANQPAVDSGAAVTEVVGALPDGGVVEVDVLGMVQAVADGTDWHGFRISTGSTATGQKFYATDSGAPAWELSVVLSDAPDQPSALKPDGGGAVATGEPILAWTFVDLGGVSTTQADSKVQVDTPAAGAEPDGTTPDFDSGWVANVDPEYDLAAATYTPPGSPPGPTYWRVRVRDGAGVQSEWSEWASFTVAALPTLVVDSPTGAFGDPTPQVTAHLTGGTVASWKVYATRADRSDVRAESGTMTGPVDWTVPLRNPDGRRVFTETAPGWLYLRVYDTVDRAEAVGQKAFVDVWIPVDLTESGTVTAPTGLTVTQLADGDPRSTWEWSRTEAADAWLIEVDGETVERLEPEDVAVSAGVYTWTDAGQVSPLRPHTLKVRAVEGEEKSAGAAYDRTHTVAGVWLIPTDGDPVKLLGTAVSEFARADRVATYTPLVGGDVDVIYDRLGRAGTFVGGVDAERMGEAAVWAALDTIEALRLSPTRRARMVWGSQSIMVRLRDPDATSHDEITPTNLKHVVRFGFVQTGD